MSQKTRSSLVIKAVAQAVASGAAHALSPAKKLNAIAALAGFVLRLIRSRQQVLPEAGQSPAKVKQGDVKAVRTQSERSPNKGGLNHG